MERNRQRFGVHPTILRNLFLLTVGQNVFVIIILLTPIVAPLIILKQTGSIALAGLAGSIAFGIRVIIVYQSGRLMDKFGRVKVLALGFLLGIIATLVLATGTIAESFPIFIIGLIILGLGIGIMQQNRLAAADLFPLERRGLGIAYFMTASVVGTVATPFLTNLSSQYAASWSLSLYAVPWFFATALLVVGLGTTLLVKPDPRDIAQNLTNYYPEYGPAIADPRKNEPQSVPLNFRALISIFPILVALVVSGVSQGVMSMMMGLTSVFLAQHGAHIQFISLALTIHTIGMFGLSIPFGKIADRYGRKKTMLTGLGLLAAGAILTPLTTEHSTITLAITLVGLGWSGALVASTSVIADVLRPKQRGAAIGVTDMGLGAAALTFPLVGSALFQLSSFTATGFFGLIVTVPAIILTVLLKEKRPGFYSNQSRLV
jgi:MFS family permease